MMLNFEQVIPQLLFVVATMCSLAIALLAVTASNTKKFQFYPPPQKEGWQHPTFMWLFRGFVYPLFVLSVLNFKPIETWLDTIFVAIGIFLLLVGFGLAFWITFQMGWRNAFGEKKGLVTTGWFRFSRNPVYVVTWLGLIGWFLIIRDSQVSILLAIWGLLYFFAPYFEEPWLEQMYGQPYLDYKVETSRFWSLPF